MKSLDSTIIPSLLNPNFAFPSFFHLIEHHPFKCVRTILLKWTNSQNALSHIQTDRRKAINYSYQKWSRSEEELSLNKTLILTRNKTNSVNKAISRYHFFSFKKVMHRSQRFVPFWISKVLVTTLQNVNHLTKSFKKKVQLLQLYRAITFSFCWFLGQYKDICSKW